MSDLQFLRTLVKSTDSYLKFSSVFIITRSAILFIKGNAQFVQKVTFEPLMDFKQNHYGSW